MDSYQFYKSIYDRELNRRKDLDAAINLPITILTILVAANSYLISKTDVIHQKSIILASNIILTLIIISFLVSTFFLTRSYNNLFKGFGSCIEAIIYKETYGGKTSPSLGYRFFVNSETYKGLMVEDEVHKIGDSICVVYYANYPDFNRSASSFTPDKLKCICK